MTATFDLAGHTAIVTGAGQGIGRSVTRAFTAAGCHVVAVDLDEQRLQDEFESDPSISIIGADVASPDAAARAVQDALDRTGRLDALVNNAGITRDAVVWKLTADQWAAVIAVHLTGTFNFIHAAVPTMRSQGRGRIVNVTSYTGLHGNIGQANYAAAKAGIIGLTKTVAKETARFGITVNAVSPNAETPMVEAVPPDKKRELLELVPMGRFGQPGEIATAIAFLASDAAAYITGAVLPVDGGMSM